MKTLMKWVAGLCVVAWAVHNPGQVGMDINRLIGAGESFVSSVANAGGSALSGVTGGVTGGTSSPAPVAPASAPAPAPAPSTSVGH
jgi:hypothetical protein